MFTLDYSGDQHVLGVSHKMKTFFDEIFSFVLKPVKK